MEIINKESKYNVGQLVKHKLGFLVVITRVSYGFGTVVTEQKEVEVRVGWPWNRETVKKTLPVETLLQDVRDYRGRIWVAGQQPEIIWLQEDELETVKDE